ncbi:MAG TPA: oligosaccharide flippase family protein, partial [Candidatus Binatia bacterium]|nr:oligosaccharide flippase family protein [Candidatus Binatia bacterium]
MSLRSEDRPLSLAVTLYRGSAVFLVIYGLGSAISFAVHLLMARLLGAKSYGYFVYATSWMAILLLGCHIGLKPTVLRFAAAYKARGEWGALRGLLRYSTISTIAASALTITLSVSALWFLRPDFDELGMTLALVALALPFTALAELWSSAVRGLGAVARSQYPASIIQHLLVGIALLVCVFVVGDNSGAVAAAAAFLVATMGAMAAARFFLRLELPREVPMTPPRYHRDEWLQVAGSNLLISLFQAVRAPLIVVIAGAYVDAQQIAFYVAAHRLANVMSLALLGISGFASPLISQYFALADISKLQNLARLAARGAFAGALATALALVGFGDDLLGLFGAGFETAYISLLVLVGGELIAAAAGPIGFFMTMTNRQ